MHLELRWGPPSSPDLWTWIVDKLAPPLVTGIILVLLGSWLLARANEANRGRREHFVKGVDLLLTTLDDLQEKAATYWATTGQNAAQEAAIEYKLQLLDAVLSTCTGSPDAPNEEVDSLFVQLAGEIVTDQFGSASRVAELDRGRTIAGIGGSLADVVIRSRWDVVHDTWLKRLERWMRRPVGHPRCERCGR